MKEFTWLKEEDEKMYWDICKMTSEKTAFTTTGCNNDQNSVLERHQNLKDHITSISDLKLRKKISSGSWKGVNKTWIGPDWITDWITEKTTKF